MAFKELGQNLRFSMKSEVLTRGQLPFQVTEKLEGNKSSFLTPYFSKSSDQN